MEHDNIQQLLQLKPRVCFEVQADRNHICEANANQDEADTNRMKMSLTKRNLTLQQPELTFEEDKLALAVLVHGIYLGGQASPEHADEHGVSWHHSIISHPPEPVVLKESHKKNTVRKQSLVYGLKRVMSHLLSLQRTSWFSLENWNIS